MRYNIILLIILLFGSCYHTIGQRLQYPITLQRPTVDNYHGVEVMDEYQWLEDLNRPEVRIWIDDQNKVSEKYLKKLANQHNSVNLMNKYMLRKTRWDVYRNINFDNKRKSNYRLFYNDTYSTPSIYFKENNFNRYKILVDPQEISGKDRIDIESFEPSKDDKYLAYAYSRNGQDWREIKIKHTQGLNSPKETLSDIKFSSIRWMKDGFYYKKYPKSDITDKLGKPAIYFHKLFTEQSQDSLIFESKNPNDELYMYSNFEESMYLLEIANRAEHKFSYFYFDPSEAIKAFRPLFYKVDYTLSFVDYRKDHFIMRASIKGNQHLVSIPIDNPQKTALLTPAMPDAQLTGFELLDDRLVGTYQSLSKPHMIVLDLNGNLLKEINLPDGISISGMNYQKATNEFIFYMESFTIPPVICKLDLETYEYEVIERTGVNFDFKDYKFKVEYALSTDSTEVPVFIVYKNELTKNSSTPFLIQAYGGYGVISTPSYEPGIIYFIEQGGAFAFVHARGGGEKGNVWWQDGKRLNKQHCFDDVIASTEHLIREGYTNAKKTAIMGSSHGGLVAGAVLTQRPDLYAAGVIKAGLLDMLRFETVTVGSKWVDEFGTVADEEDFANLSSYSPYHNLSDTINYPPILITTGSSDDRVSPMHSYKLAARMQQINQQKNQILLWSQDGVGHQEPSSIEDRLHTEAYVFGFLEAFVLNQD